MYYVGGTVVMHRSFNETKIFEDIEREKVTLLFAVSSMIVRLVEHPDIGRHDLSSLRKIWTGAEPFPIPTILKIKETWPTLEFIQAYGFTEGISTTSFLEDKYAISKIGSVGKPFYGVEATVLDERGREVSPGGTGELVQRGTQVMREYWSKPPEAGPTFDENGWYHSGDLVRLDEEGYMYIVGRIKDMIISGGENIYPAEVEQVLYTHPKIKEAAVIGVPDEKWGEAVKAIVVLQPGEELAQADVIEYCRQNIASYKKPKYVEFVEELPRLASGKIAKAELKHRYGRPQ
jgi:fatty-acyl-CoA synthase